MAKKDVVTILFLSNIVMSLNLIIMKLLIKSLMFSHFSYAISAWCVSLKHHLAKRNIIWQRV